MFYFYYYFWSQFNFIWCRLVSYKKKDDKIESSEHQIWKHEFQSSKINAALLFQIWNTKNTQKHQCQFQSFQNNEHFKESSIHVLFNLNWHQQHQQISYCRQKVSRYSECFKWSYWSSQVIKKDQLRLV